MEYITLFLLFGSIGYIIGRFSLQKHVIISSLIFGFALFLLTFLGSSFSMATDAGSSAFLPILQISIIPALVVGLSTFIGGKAAEYYKRKLKRKK